MTSQRAIVRAEKKYFEIMDERDRGTDRHSG